MEYGVSVQDYLYRARERLAVDAKASLIYAALELRSGIEARAKEYASANESLFAKRKLGWEIAKLTKDLERAFRIGDKIVEIRVSTMDNVPVATWLHTPIGPTLGRMAGQLGNLLHVLSTKVVADEAWWHAQRLLVQDATERLAVAAAGNLMGPPIRNRKTGTMRVVVYAEPGMPQQFTSMKGSNVMFNVRYLSELPGYRPNDV